MAVRSIKDVHGFTDNRLGKSALGPPKEELPKVHQATSNPLFKLMYRSSNGLVKWWRVYQIRSNAVPEQSDPDEDAVRAR